MSLLLLVVMVVIGFICLFIICIRFLVYYRNRKNRIDSQVRNKLFMKHYINQKIKPINIDDCKEETRTEEFTKIDY